MNNKSTDKEQIILETATRLFLENGFAATSTTKIAKEAGCNQALVHYYFRTKEKLFESIFTSKFKYFISGMLDVGKENLPFEEKVRLRIENHFDMIRENPKLPMLLVYEFNTNPKRITTLKESLAGLPTLIFSDLQKEIDEEFSKGNIRNISALDLIYSILSLNISAFTIGPIFKEFTDTDDETYEKFIDSRREENTLTIINSLRP